MTSVESRPAELMILVFPGERAHPAVAQVLAEIADGRDITVLDLVFVTRTSRDLIRIASARETLHDVGLGPIEALAASAPTLIGEADLGVVRDWLRPGTSAAVIAYEHSWARRLARAVRETGGVVMFSPSAGHLAEERQAVSESEAAVREAEAEVAAAERSAERYSTLGPIGPSGPMGSRPASADDLVSQLADLARLRYSGALSAAEFEAAKATLLTT
jgi:hypothetical protein